MCLTRCFNAEAAQEVQKSFGLRRTGRTKGAATEGTERNQGYEVVIKNP